MNLTEELEFSKIVIKEAGKILLRFLSNPTGVERKSDDTLVSDADKESSIFLQSEMGKRFPGFSILNEEMAEDGTRFSREYCWVVDPLDDTRGYLAGKNTFGIMIGLMRNFQPVMGVTYRPLNDELVYATRGVGAYLERNGVATRISSKEHNPIKVLVSDSRTSEELERLLEVIGEPKQIIKMGGSLKTIEVAKGNADLFLCPQTSVMHLWDLCAAQVILEESDGRLSDLSGKSFDYTQKETANRGGVIASTLSRYHKVVNSIAAKIPKL